MHWKVESAREEKKTNVAAVALVIAGGAEEIVVCGADVSIVNVCCAGLGSMLPAWSRARTMNVWLPFARPVY